MIERLIFLGDFFYDYKVEEDDIRVIEEWIQAQNAHVILNLEGPLSNNGSKIKKRGPNLYQSNVSVEILKRLNVIGVSLANNHIMDYGADALRETLDILDKNGILHTGAGRNCREANRPMMFRVQNEDYYFYSYGWEIEEVRKAGEQCYGAASYKRNEIYNNVKKDIQDGKKVILLMHWGFENNLLPQPIDVEFAHKAIELGTELVIGHHPHVIQPYEVYNNHRIYYSLGNFYFSSRREKFVKQFNTRTPYESDYGLGVLWDTRKQKYEHFIIHYNREKKESEIEQASLYNVQLLNDLDYTSKQYRKRLRQNKRNVNPVLLRDNAVNRFKLVCFSFIIRRIVRRLFVLIKKGKALVKDGGSL